jgi:hypothetical protein
VPRWPPHNPGFVLLMAFKSLGRLDSCVAGIS